MASKYNKNMSHDELVSALNAVKARKDQMESQSMDSIKQDLKGWTKEHKDLTAQAKDLESKLKDDQVDKPQQKEPKISEPKVAKVAENDEATFDSKRYKQLQSMDKLNALSPKQEKELRELDKQYREIEKAKQEARPELKEIFSSIGDKVKEAGSSVKEKLNDLKESFTTKDTKAEAKQKTAETKTEPKVAKVAENDETTFDAKKYKQLQVTNMTLPLTPEQKKELQELEATFDDKKYKRLQSMNKLGILSPKQEKELRELDKQYKEMQTAKQEAVAEVRENLKSIGEKAEAEQKIAETKTENTVADKIGDGLKTTANFAGNVIKNSLPFGLGKLFDDDTAKTQEAQNEKEKEAQREAKANNVLDKLGLGAVATTSVELLSKMKESVTNDDKAKAEVAQQATQQQENTEQMKMTMR